MPWNPSLNSLQNVLADLYPADADARRVASEANLSLLHVDFDGPAIDVWHNVLEEALREEKVDAVVAVARGEYEGNEALARAIAAYRPGPPTGTGGEPAEQPSARRLSVALPVLLVAAIGLIALFVFLASRVPSRHEASQPHETGTSTPEAVAVTTATATHTPAPALSPTPSPESPTLTPWPTPVFVSQWVYDLGSWTERLEYSYEPGILPSATITDFLRLSRVELGELREADGSHPGFNIRFTIKNTDSRPMALDLDHRFFSLKDAQGRAGDLIYFCCTASGVILPPGEEREMQLVFRSYPGWLSKQHGVSAVTVAAEGLRPVLRAAWRLQLPVTAD